MKVLSPGKVILTGEHAVVHGRPALVTAVDRFAEATVREAPDLISLDLLDLEQQVACTAEGLQEHKDRLAKRYAMFLDGKMPIQDVLQRPPALFEYALGLMVEELGIEIDGGLRIHICSNIPIGCGMGSSAATVVSLLYAVAETIEVRVEPEQIYRLALEAEKLQHGHPSGVDPCTSLYGGLVRFQNGKAESREMPPMQFCLVDTGVPETTTGECVEQVRDRFGEGEIWDEFAVIEKNMESALADNKTDRIKELVRENHRLLTQIGVVPERVQCFIDSIEQQGGAAKICGAGAVAGHQGGIVWVISDSTPTQLCQDFEYNLISAQGEAHGARII